MAFNQDITPLLKDQKALTWWLFCCMGMIFLMVMLGGATRLTGSGLSIVEWQPFKGIFPPLTQEAWQDLFTLYQQSPQFQLENYNMSLKDFKGIFWLEYIHRLWGRLIGIVLLGPLFYFFFQKRLYPDLSRPLFLSIMLVGLQGLMGWVMVKSGLNKDPFVSPFLLAVHLMLAFLIYGILLNCFLKIVVPLSRPQRVSWQFYVIFTLFLTTTFYGALVAGNKAGLIYNTFPLMGESFVPGEIFFLQPWFVNFFYNAATVQFIHRLLAILTLTVGVCFSLKLLKPSNPALAKGALLFITALCGQFILGISTLLTQVPLFLGLFHQAGAFIIFTILVTLKHHLKDSL